jgi:hypothetical protein
MNKKNSKQPQQAKTEAKAPEPGKLESPFDIDTTIFNKEDKRTEDLHLQLSEKYMAYKDLADRCIINPTLIGKLQKTSYEHNCRYR